MHTGLAFTVMKNYQGRILKIFTVFAIKCTTASIGDEIVSTHGHVRLIFTTLADYNN